MIIFINIFKVTHVSYKRYPSVAGLPSVSVLSDRLIVYTKSRKQLLHRKYLLYETGCILVTFFIWASYFKDIHHQFYLANVIVHPTINIVINIFMELKLSKKIKVFV